MPRRQTGAMSSAPHTTSSRVRRRALAAASLMVAAATALAGCSHDSTPPPKPPPSSPSTSPPTSAPTTPPPAPPRRVWPLTGAKLKGHLPKHPVYVVKVDNTGGAQPQLGLDQADMVVEELVEGGLTRLAAFCYSHIPADIGPVRSMRASDIGIVEPANAFIVASGAAGKTMKLLNEANIDRVTEGAAGFYRSSARPAPYNLFMRLTALAKHVSRHWKPPSGTYLPFGKTAAFQGTRRVHAMTVRFSGAHTTEWKYNGISWVRTNSYAKPGQDFRTKNVLILRVRIGDAGYLDPGGNPVPETFFYGSGDATLVHGDQAVSGRWHKHGTKGAVTLTTRAGKRLSVPVGHTFVELVPIGSSAAVTLRK